jgi:uncharacterized zinc-type alcohol dehydrogenase-like protein
MKIDAFAATRPKEPLQPFSYPVPSLGPFDILIKVSHCGLCHSDIHLIDDDWKKSQYPLVPGHEVVGTVEKMGDQITNLKLGQRVGVSWIRASCLNCPSCLEGNTNICPQKAATCNGHYGGFANFLVADGRFSFPIPDGIGSAHAAPLLCAGATVYSPIRRYCSDKKHSVAILGIGGLGHLALQFASAFGCETTAISHSQTKESEAKSFGADHFSALEDAAQFDFILSTVYADLDWNRVIAKLKPKGTLCFVGRPKSAGLIDLGPLISYEKTICGSATANRPMMNEMLAFAGQNQIKPQIEIFPLSEVNRAIEKVKQNQVRYRAVLEM